MRLPEMRLRAAGSVPPMRLLALLKIWMPCPPLPKRGGAGGVGADAVALDDGAAVLARRMP